MKRWTGGGLALGLLALALPGVVGAAPEPLKIGVRPDNFRLVAPDGKQHALKQDPMPKATVVLFVATQCPVSLDYDQRMAELALEYESRGVRFIGVNSNKQESLAEVGDHARSKGLPFPVVKDPNNVLADRWGATVTPEAFVLDQAGELQYHGRIDDSRDPSRVTSQDLRKALDAILAGRRPATPNTRAFGCTIKRA